MEPSLPEALLNSVRLPIIAIDDRGCVLSLNAAARGLLSPDVTEPTGQPVDALFPNLKVLLDGLDSGMALQREISLDATRIAEASVTPLTGFGWAITIYDVTGHKDDQARKNELLGEVTHDLKSPLTAILSFSDLIEAAGELTPKQSQFLARIRATATRMTEQVHELLDVVWIESGMKLTLTEVDLLSLVKSTLDMSEPRAAARQIQLKVEIPETIPTIIADTTRLGQVIANLVNNAVKYSEPGKTVTVNLSTEPGQVVLTVRDQGFGIAPEHLPNLFERFYRVRDAHTRQIEGTGLGLYIARSIVEQHGGKIAVVSEPDVGTVFTVHLPLKQDTSLT